jgi:hypothetical protein
LRGGEDCFDSFEGQFPSVEGIARSKTVRSFHLCAGEGRVDVVVVVMFRNLQIFGKFRNRASEAPDRHLRGDIVRHVSLGIDNVFVRPSHRHLYRTVNRIPTFTDVSRCTNDDNRSSRRMRFSTTIASTVIFYAGASSELDLRDPYCPVPDGDRCDPSIDRPCCGDAYTLTVCAGTAGTSPGQFVWDSETCFGLGCSVLTDDMSCSTDYTGIACA